MCVLVGHPGTRLGVPSRCGNFFCWGNSGWRRWILLNSAILNSDTKICFPPPPHPGLKVRSESLPDLFPQGNKNEISQIPSFVSFLSCCIPCRILCQPCQGSCPQCELCQEKENLEAGVLQSQNFLPTRACKWILVNFDEFWWIGAPAFLTHQGLQVNFAEFYWILVDFGSRESFAVQGMGAPSEQEPKGIGLKQFFNYFFK